MNGYFISGTDTDVGKTVLSALLLAELRSRGKKAAPMKPAQTGCGVHPFTVPDLDFSLKLANMSVSTKEYGLMAPYCYEPACSPHLAAERANETIEIAEMVIAARTLAKDYELVLAEGAGGIMVPLNRKETNLDLMHALGLPVILAIRPGLGTINHTLLSIRALRSDGLPLAGIVVVKSTDAPSSFIEEDNLKTIEAFGKVPVLGTIPFTESIGSAGWDDLPETTRSAIRSIVDQLDV